MPNDKPAGLLARLRSGLNRTRKVLTTPLTELFKGTVTIDDELLEELETLLLSADVGVPASQRLLESLRSQVAQEAIHESDAVVTQLKSAMLDILKPAQQPLHIIQDAKGPFMILMVGINGAGKTTTIAKLARRYQNEGHSVMLAAGDTFRAAAISQLQNWGQRYDIPVIAQQPGADSASVIYDALESARARHIDILIADTAGRLHTQSGLMAELAKIKRIAAKLNPDAPHETLLVLDAGTGQNAIVQAQQFNEKIGITGLVLSKLDGTAKGGVLLAIAEQLRLPIRFIGVGEGIDDLRPFDSEDFVTALLSR